MVVMALDHIRDYFHFASFNFDPADPTQTTFPIYFTRWITHYCAPAFCFLAGISAFLVGRKKNKKELSAFLWKLGLWLVILEMTIVNFAWYFDFRFGSPGLFVIWSLGISMIALAALVHLPRMYIFIFSIAMICGHNLLDKIHYDGNMLWAILHESTAINLLHSYKMYVGYPIIPWIAVMSLGFCFGFFYDPSFDKKKRRKILNTIGISAIAMFVLVRSINAYGDPVPWTHFDSVSKLLMSFMNPSKYPPSLSYLLMTLGPALIFLANSENLKGRVVQFFSTFGRVPWLMSASTSFLRVRFR